VYIFPSSKVLIATSFLIKDPAVCIRGVFAFGRLARGTRRCADASRTAWLNPYATDLITAALADGQSEPDCCKDQRSQ